jgi:hypothetical protein
MLYQSNVIREKKTPGTVSLAHDLKSLSGFPGRFFCTVQDPEDLSAQKYPKH